MIIRDLLASRGVELTPEECRRAVELKLIALIITDDGPVLAANLPALKQINGTQSIPHDPDRGLRPE